MTSASAASRDVVRTEADYVDGTACKLFITRFVPRRQNDARHVVLCLPPFAEEMNKSRRMLALQGRSLAERGVEFALPDVRGTGDSEGAFGDVPWDSWCDDVGCVVSWLRAEGVEHIDVLAIRSGVFLGRRLLQTIETGPRRIALWSPVLRGAAMLDQLFRTMLIRNAGGDGLSSVADIRARLLRDGGMEVAGYWLSDALLESVDELDISDVQLANGSRIQWADVSPAKTDRVPRKTAKIMDSWVSRRLRTKYSRFVGPQFWMGPEIELVPALLAETTDFFTRD